MKYCPFCNYPLKIKSFRDLPFIEKVVELISRNSETYTKEPDKYICPNCKKEIMKHYNDQGIVDD